MPRVEDRSVRDRIADVEQLTSRLEPLHVQTEILVMRRHEPWAAAGIRTVEDIEALLSFDPVPEVIDRRRDLDLLIDPKTGARKLRHLTEDKEGFDAIAAQCELVRITITVHEAQLPALLSPAGVVAVLGGNRSGKTRIGLYWLIRQWMLRGQAAANDKPAAVFWLLAPTDPKAWKRLVRGLAPLIPAALRVGDLPRSHRSARMVITMIDGCEIEALNTYGDGDNLKSENVHGILFDEAGACRHPGNWQQCQSRTSQTGAPVMLDTTPKPGHWAYEEIVLQEPHAGGAIQVFHLDLFHNPWMTTPRIWHLLIRDTTLTQHELEEQVLPTPDPAAACREIVTSPRALREHFGVWTADGIVLWSEWTPAVAAACTRAGQGVWINGLGELEPVTAQAAAGVTHFAGLDLEEVEVLGGQDFNVNPQTTVIVQVLGLPEDPSTWVLYVADEVQTQGTIELHGEKLTRTWPGLVMACDPTGDIPRRKQGATDGDEAARLRDMGLHCHSCVGRGRRMASSKPSINLLHWLMKSRRLVIHLRCKNLIKALQVQQARPDGRIAKRAGTNSPSDKASAPTDALRYIAWALFGSEYQNSVVEIAA